MVTLLLGGSISDVEINTQFHRFYNKIIIYKLTFKKEMMFTKNIVSPYHHTLLSAKNIYKIIFSNAKSFYLKLGSYLNVYVSFHIHFIYKYKYIVVKLYLNLCFCSGNIYILVGWGGAGGIILLPGTSYSKGDLDPCSPYFPTNIP